MKELKKFTVPFLLAANLLSSCLGNAALPSSPAEGNAFTNALLPLDSTATALTEIKFFNPTWQSGSVWGVQYSINENHVFGVYAHDGRLVEWNVDTADVVATHNLGIVHSNAVDFSPDGEILMGPTGFISTTSEDTKRPVDYVSGISAWATGTGELIQCFSLPCPDREAYYPSRDLGAVLDPLGNQALLWNEYSIKIPNFSGDRTEIILVDNEESTYSWNIGHIAMNPVNRRLVAIYQEGLVEVRGDVLNIPIALGKKNDFSDVPAALFDPSGSLLAYIRGDLLILMRVGGYFGIRVFDKEMDTAFSLKFDQTGKLLFVTSQDKITVLDVSEKQVVAEYLTPGITTLNISQDNRLLLWGDENGIIHIWGIRKPQSFMMSLSSRSLPTRRVYD